MLNAIKNIRFSEAVIDIKIIEEEFVLVSDASTSISYLDYQTLEAKNRLNANIKHQRFLNSVVAFSSTSEYLVLISAETKESKLYNIKIKKLITSVSRHQGEVSCVAIDPKDRYMFSCGEDGMVFGVDIKSGQLAFTLPRHVDTINDIAFSQNAHYVATASFDKNIFLFNLATMSPMAKLRAHSAPVIKVQFLKNNRLFSVDKKNSAIIWDIATVSVLCRLQGIHDDITKVTVSNDCMFLFLGTKLGYILVYDLTTYALIAHRYLKHDSSITALAFDELRNYLFVGTEGGGFFVYDIFNGEESLKNAIADKRYTLLPSYIDANPLLAYTKTFHTFELLWDKTLQKAKEFIEKSEKQKAMKLFENFLEIPSKKQFVQKLLLEYEEYDKFLLFISQNKLALAYALANKYQVYKESGAYKELEAQWKKTLTTAQKYLSNPNNQEKVKELFAPYRGIPEKTVIIQDLFTNSMVCARFKNSMIHKDFKLAYEYVKKYPFLRESSEYSILIQYSDTLYIKAQEFQKNKDTHSAIKLYRMLLDFEDFKEEAKAIIQEIETQQKFFNALHDSDMVTAYDLLDSSYDLQQTSEGKKLEEIWESEYNKASEYASRGDIDGVKNALQKYMGTKSKYMAIATSVAWCYITQLDRALKSKAEQKIIENGIKNYMLYYGLTGQITTFFEQFLKSYPQTKLNLESQKQGAIENWRPPMMVKSILD